MARKAMIDAGFQPDTPAEVDREVARLDEPAELARRGSGVRDLRDILWSSIDNDDTRDLDQVEYVETLPGGEMRVIGMHGG